MKDYFLKVNFQDVVATDFITLIKSNLGNNAKVIFQKKIW